jgi:hypothetical protein
MLVRAIHSDQSFFFINISSTSVVYNVVGVTQGIADASAETRRLAEAIAAVVGVRQIRNLPNRKAALL